MTAIKICGIKDPQTLRVAADAGARFAGFVFYPSSPRYLETEIAAQLVREMPTGMRSVGLFVDPTVQDLLRVASSVSLDMIQLHGEETPQRVNEISALMSMPVIKAIRLRYAEDVALAYEYENVADWLLFDSKTDHELPGGTGLRFDWELLKDKTFKKPWMLSGGLDAENVSNALKILKPDAVDVSSGVESTRGVKDPAKIKAFIQAVKSAI